MSKRLLPIMTANGSVENLPRGGYVYADKTAYLHSLVRQEGTMCFLSRPRRFGKSLTVFTLEAIFQGKRELFKGLAIDALDYDWKTYPVIPIDFGDMCDALKAGETKRYMEILASFFAASRIWTEGGRRRTTPWWLRRWRG